jgi:hypothetical protein
MSPTQDYSDNDSLCYSVSVGDENDFSSDLFFETAIVTNKAVVIFGDGFHPHQQQHDSIKPQNDTSKRRKVKMSSSRPSMTKKYPKANTPLQTAIPLK